MVKPETETTTKKYPKMTAQQRKEYEKAVAEELASKEENIAAARKVAKQLKAERQPIIELVAILREARKKAKVSLNELEKRTGIPKSAWSRLENSLAPNPTMLTLYRYADALGLSFHSKLKRGSARKGRTE